MSPKPTLVFVPGSWHTPETWSKVTTILESQHFKCVCVSLPSVSKNTSATFADDIKATRDAIIAETTQGRDVVVVVHSYGGVVGSSAVKGLTRPKQAAPQSTTKASGHIIGLCMIATGFNRTGLSFLEGAGGTPPPSWTADWSTGFATLVVDPRPLFYHDLPLEEGNLWVSKLQKQSLIALAEGGEHSYAGWMDVPVWFLATVEDRALPVAFQRVMVEGARSEGAEVTLREVGSGHSPMLSKPVETAKFIEEAVECFVR